MQKIPTLFVRDPQNMRYVLPEVHPDCGWVLAREGAATRKYDGTCVMLDENGDWWARREVKPGRPMPLNFQMVDYDPVTEIHVGWEPISQSSFARWHTEALEPLTEFGGLIGRPILPGTFELVGPKVNGNPMRLSMHRLESHANAEQLDLSGIPTYPAQESIPWVHEILGKILADLAAGDDPWEGIVWHHPDGRMAKLKSRDFATLVERG